MKAAILRKRAILDFLLIYINLIPQKIQIAKKQINFSTLER